MSKKSKKFDQDAGQAVEAPVNTTVEAPAEAKAPAIPRNPSLYLEDVATGVQYKFDRRALPKKAAFQSVPVGIDGESTSYQVTSNKGWAKDEDHVIEYIWVTLPNGVEGYITLDYKQSAVEFVGEGRNFKVGEGKANRDNPSRVGVDEREQGRIAKFQATFSARKGTSQTATEGTAEEAAAE